MGAPTTYYVDTVNGSDSNAGTSPGSGNAWLTLKYAIETGITRDATNGDRIMIYAPVGTPDAITSAAIDLQQYATDATATAPLIIQGSDSAQTGYDTAYLTCTGLMFISDAVFDHLTLHGLHVTGGNSTGLMELDRSSTIIGCTFVQTSTGFNTKIDGALSKVLFCEFSGAGTNTVILDMIGNAGLVLGCYLHETTNAVDKGLQAGDVVMFTVVHVASTDANCGMIAGSSSSTMWAFNSLINDSAGVTGGINASGVTQVIVNNYIQGQSGTGGYAIRSTGSNAHITVGNRWYNCTTGLSLTDSGIDTDNSATSASGVTNAGSGDYSPTSELKALAWPEYIAGVLSNLSIGAIQQAAGSGGGLLTHPGMAGGLRG